MKNDNTKIMTMHRQNKLKWYIMASRGFQVGLLNVMAFNHWLFQDWSGAWWFLGFTILLQLYIITLQTRVRRSRALYVRLYGKTQPQTESYFS
jgi:hypothetical protein